MSHTLKVHLDREPSFYTTEDVISGTLQLTVNREIEVKDIQVKLEGHSNSRVTVYTYNRKNERRRDTRHETHELFYDVMTVFPPPNVRDAMKNRKPSFTLTPGEYSYPFSLQFSTSAHCGDPLSKKKANLYNSSYETGARKSKTTSSIHGAISHGHYQLPPSLEQTEINGDSFDIRYMLKVSLHRANFFSVDTRMARTLQFYPRGPSSIQAINIIKTCYFLYSDMTVLNVSAPEKGKGGWLSSKPTRQISFALGVTTSQMLIPGTMPFSIHILSNKDAQFFTYDTKQGTQSLGRFYLTQLSIGLNNSIELQASGNRTTGQFQNPLFSYRGPPVLIDLANLKPTQVPNTRYQYDLDLTHILKDWTLPPHMIPTFAICNGVISQSLYIRASFVPSLDQHMTRPEKITLTHRIIVLSPVMDREDETVVNDYTAPPSTLPAPTLAPAYKPQENQAEELPTYQEATSTTLDRLD